MKDELKPCPFCGRKAYIYKDEYIGTYRAECRNTRCSCIPSTWFCETKEGAADLWNRRAADEVRD